MTTNPISHTDEAALLDDHAVDLFANAMKEKLKIKRQQGFGGWDDITKCSGERLAELLLRAVAKGDPVDVANFAMMLFCRDESHDALKASVVGLVGIMPDGWKLVPIEPTRGMVIDGFEAVSEFKDSEEFEEMSGCQGAAEAARICYRTMLSVAPPAQTSPMPNDEELLSHFSKYWEHQWHDGLYQQIRFPQWQLLEAARALLAMVRP
jgi:hypothetical protein